MNKTQKNKTQKRKGGYLSKKKQSIKKSPKTVRKSLKAKKSQGMMTTVLPFILNK